MALRGTRSLPRPTAAAVPGNAVAAPTARPAAAAPRNIDLLDSSMVIPSGLLRTERRVESRGRWIENQPPDELHRLFGTPQPVHAGVLPLHRDRPGVLDRVQRTEGLLP